MKPTYQRWLEQQKYDAGTITSQLHRVSRVEKHHGSLDDHYINDRLQALISMLRYSKDDSRLGRPNPSKIPFDGDAYNNLASYRNAVERYRKFRDSVGNIDQLTDPAVAPAPQDADDDIGQRIGLERDMQAALRKEIAQLEPNLVIVDDGAERSVDSGFIDITARDTEGYIVVIELKAGPAGQRAVAQILSYMGDVASEQDSKVRGILIAAEFDHKAKAAARMVPNLALRRYGIRFQFSDGAS